MATKTARVLYGATSAGSSFFDPDLRWLTSFDAPDPFVAVVIDGRTTVFVSDLEYGRARKEIKKHKVVRIRDFLEQENLPDETSASDLISHFIRKNKIKKVEFSSFFSPILGLAQAFSAQSTKRSLFDNRAIKTNSEISHISKVRDATESVLTQTLRLLEKTTVKLGKVYDPRGVFGKKNTYVTSEAVRSLMNRELLEHECFCPDAVIASGDQAVDPHNSGSGILEANVPIVFDIFPRSLKTLYFYDTTRTVVKGKLNTEAKRMYQTVKDVQQLALEQVKVGTNGRKIHQIVDNFFEKHGYTTGMHPIPGSRGKKLQGFIHGTGHGLGIDIHEFPRIGRTDNILQENMIVTVEPGLYYYGVGGVRIEDTVVVTNTGHKNLSRIPKELLEL